MWLVYTNDREDEPTIHGIFDSKEKAVAILNRELPTHLDDLEITESDHQVVAEEVGEGWIIGRAILMKMNVQTRINV